MKYLILASVIWCMAGTAPGVETVRASSFGFQADNATECLRKAIGSGAKTVMVDNTGSDWIIDQVKLRSDLELVIADGVTVRALPGAFKQQNDCLFSAWDARNLTLRGEGKARLIMNKKDYQDTSRYKWSEWRHLISLRGCENVAISNLTLESSGGDGIYVSTSAKMPGCHNVLIENITALDHHRQGISIISVDKLVIRNSKFNNTSGTPPAAGIDFEPNKADEWISDCLVENCEFNNNAGAGILFHLAPLTAVSKPVSAAVRNCVVDSNIRGIVVTASRTTPVRGEITFENCRVTDSAQSAFTLTNQQDGELKIMLKDCLFDNRKSDRPAIILNNNGTSRDLSGVKFDRVRLLLGKAVPMVFHGSTGGGVTGLNGSLLVEQAGQKSTEFDFAAFAAANRPRPELRTFQTLQPVLKGLVPLNTAAKAGKESTDVWFRGNLSFLQYAGAAGEYPIRFKTRQVSKFPINIEVQVKDAQGTDVDRFSITGKEFTYPLKANGRNLFVFEIKTKGQAVAVRSTYPGNAVLAANRVGIFKSGGGKLYFRVPKDIRDISIEISAALNEPVTAELLDPQEKSVDSVEKLQGSRILKYSRPDASKDEVWCLSFPYALEDFQIRIGAPLQPLASTLPDYLLIPAR